MARMFAFPMALAPEYYTAIGEVAARSAHLEHQLGELIWAVLDLGKKEGRVLTHGMAVKPKSNVIRALSLRWIKDDQLRREAKSIAKEALELKSKRDEIVHGLWGHNSEGDPTDIHLVRMASAEQRILPLAERKRPEEIKALADRFFALQKRVHNLLVQIVAARERESSPPLHSG